MKRGAGFLALFTVLLTGMHFVNGPASPRSSTEVRAAERQEASIRIPAQADFTCKAFETAIRPANESSNADKPAPEKGEIAALIDRFLDGSWASRNSSPGTLPEGIRLMIATVPDPVHTHLSLQFDRTLEAIQQAAQDERFTYDSSWIPWRPRNNESSSINDRKTEAKETAEREICPGVILFRRNMSAARPENCKLSPGSVPRPGDAPYLCGMIVFVVGEKPTSGLNRVQWDSALRWMDAHAGKSRPDRVLRVLGPTFSGSLPSFVRALENANQYSGTFDSTLLYSGRIRGCASWHWLKAELNPPPSSANPLSTPLRMPVRIADFEENDALQSDRFYRYLKDRGHRLSEIAILSEDETAYGGLPDAHSSGPENASPSPCNPEYPYSDRPVHLYYPRDISAVRSAYQEQSLFSSGSRTDASQQHTVLRSETSDPGSRVATDTIEPFSGNNLALTQEAQLYGIVNNLQTHGIRFVILRSTNSLDYLFLTRFLHRAYPTAYIVTIGSDLLFAREVDSTEFRGVVSLSSFPLLPRGQDWTKQIAAVPQHAHRIFGSYTMEGCYLAARFLITDPPATVEEMRSQAPFRHPAKPDIPDFAPPFWDVPSGAGGDSQPATWLSVIGRDGYWPLAILKETSGTAPRFFNAAVVQKPSAADLAKAAVQPHKEILSLSSSWRLCCVLAFLCLCIHFFACRMGWKHPNFGMFVQFTPIGGHRGPALICAGWATLCSLLLILFLVSLRIYPWLGSMDHAWVWVTGAAFVSACVCAAMELRWWYEPVSKEPPDPADTEAREMCKSTKSKLHFAPLWIALTFAAIALVGAAGLLILEFGGSNDSGVTTAYRSVHLTSGVSPVLSLIAMMIGFYWWFWHSLSGLALLGNGRPILPRLKKIPAGFSQVSDRLAENIDGTAMPFPTLAKTTILLYLLPLFLVILLAFVLQRAWMQAFDLLLHSLENTAFNRTLHVLLAIGLYLILLESGQFFTTWLALKRLLLALNRLPLRRTFAALQGLSMRSLWRLSGTSSRARYKIFSHQLESLLHLRNEMEAPEWKTCGSDDLRLSVRAAWAQGWHFVQERSKGPDLAMVNDDEAHAIRVRFCECAEDVLRGLLVTEWLEERASLDVRDGPAEGDAHERITLSAKTPVRLAEEFLCMIYVGYLQNLLGRMRTMVLSMTGLFAAIALSVGFYPFTPRPTISLSLLLLLLLIGTVVGIVYAGLDRDSTLSHITNTEPGSLGIHFWVRMISFVGVPAMGLIVAQFPEIKDFVLSWVAPTMNAVK